jgi:hypothetical protein
VYVELLVTFYLLNWSPVIGEWEGTGTFVVILLRTSPSYFPSPILQLIYHFLSLVDTVGLLAIFPRSRGPFSSWKFSFPEFRLFHPSAWHLRKQRCRSIIIPQTYIMWMFTCSPIRSSFIGNIQFIKGGLHFLTYFWDMALWICGNDIQKIIEKNGGRTLTMKKVLSTQSR